MKRAPSYKKPPSLWTVARKAAGERIVVKKSAASIFGIKRARCILLAMRSRARAWTDPS